MVHPESLQVRSVWLANDGRVGAGNLRCAYIVLVSTRFPCVDDPHSGCCGALQMSRQYKSPPLAEALCEFRFEPDEPWDWTMPGLLYAALGGADAYPHKEDHKALEFELNLSDDAQDERVKSLREAVNRVRFVNEPRTRIVQVGPDLLAVNCTGDYPGWPAFREWIDAILNLYLPLSKPKAIQRIGLRYINHIRIPESQVEIEDYLLAGPTVPEPVPQVFSPFMMRVQIPHPDAAATLRLQSASIGLSDHEGVAFLLDFECATADESGVALADWRTWTDKAHTIVEDAFEACLGPKARSLFEEGE